MYAQISSDLKYTNKQQNALQYIYIYIYIYCILFTISHQHVSAGIPAIFSITLLQTYKPTDFVNCVAVTPEQLEL